MSLKNRKNEYDRLVKEGREVPEVLKKEFETKDKPEPEPEQTKKKPKKK